MGFHNCYSQYRLQLVKRTITKALNNYEFNFGGGMCNHWGPLNLKWIYHFQRP